MPSLTQRKATQADVDQIVALVDAAYSKWIPVINRKPAPMTTDYHLAIQEHQFQLAIADETIVGLVEILPIANYLWIENVAVLPAWQGHGIGKKLLQMAEHEAQANNLKEIRLQTNELFEANIAMYQHFGYHLVRKEAYKEGYTVFMSKTL